MHVSTDGGAQALVARWYCAGSCCALRRVGVAPVRKFLAFVRQRRLDILLGA